MEIGVGDFQITDKMREWINQALDFNRLSYGPLSASFEQIFTKLHDCKYGILSNSGTSSLLVALQTLKEAHGWQDGDEVIVPAITFVATVNAVLQAGLKPVLVDVEPTYYGIDIGYIDNYLSSALNVLQGRVKAVIPVHTFGQPVDMFNLFSVIMARDGIEWANPNRNIKIIEDSCEAMFVKHRDKPVGSWGDIACFSTYMAHLIMTGVGGIAITNNPEYAKIMRSLVNHGMSLEDLGKDNWKLSRDFIFDRIGYSFRITELEAAIGLAQLENWPEMIECRRKNADYLTEQLKDLENRELLQLPAIRPKTEHSWMMYPIVCKQKSIRDYLCQWLNENGIGTRRMLPLISQPCYKGLWNPDDYPVAKWIDEQGFYIGCHQYLTITDLDYVVDKIYEYFK